MCFGNSKETGKKTSTQSSTAYVPDWLESGSKGVADWAGSAIGKPFQAYGGERVAGLSGGEQQASGMLSAVGSNPTTGEAGELYRTAAYAPAQKISAPRLIDNIPGMDDRAGGESGGGIQDYMNPYLEQALAPQLRALEEKGARDRMQLASLATAGGAFGDTRHAVDENLQRESELQTYGDTVGRGYAAAFDNAMGNRNLDINRLLDVAKTNAGYNETALDRSVAGGNNLLNVDRQSIDIARAIAGMGATERGVEQAMLDADYEEFAKGRDYPLETGKTIAQILAMLPYTKHTEGTGSETNYQPDNSGWQLLGALGGKALLSDRRAKTDVAMVGRLFDGSPVYRYRYGDGGPMTIGLMAQEVEQSTPEAVIEIGGLKHVDYELATRRAIEMED